MVLSILLVTSCGVSQTEYDKLLAENELLKYDLQNSIDAFNWLMENSQFEPAYFPDKSALQSWLDSGDGSLLYHSISRTFYDWYETGLYCQSKALEAGYILSVSYANQDTGLAVWCEAVTQDGHVYCFDPDNQSELFDSKFVIKSELLDIGVY